MTVSPAIRATNIQKKFLLHSSSIMRLKTALFPNLMKDSDQFYAIKDISFEIEKGACLGIIGKNGAGKSTLLKILSGVMAPSSGSFECIGRVASLLELGAGFHPEYTGIQNIYLQGTLHGLSKDKITEITPSVLEFADIGDFIDVPVKRYSSGMFARLAFSVAISISPDILIVDEALSVGDIFFQVKCHEHMQKLRAGGTTIVFVSHDLNAIMRYCSTVLWLEKGTTRMIGHPQDVVKSYVLNDFSSNQHQGNQFATPKTLNSPYSASDIKINNYSAGFLEISGFEIKDISGRPITQCELGDEIEVILELRVLAFIEMLYFIVGFLDRFSIVVHTKSSLQEKAEHLQNLQAGDILKITRKIRVALAPGEYLINLGLNSIPSKYLNPYRPENEPSIMRERRILYGIQFGPFLVSANNSPFGGTGGLFDQNSMTKFAVHRPNLK